MPEEDIHQPHDKLFAIGFGDPGTAAGLLKAQLPAELVSQIDWTSLKTESGTFVDPEFHKSHSDLLFSTSFADKPCLLYVLFEHQRQEDALMALRLLRYMINIWWTFSRDHPGQRLPIILPVVLAQNAKAWKVKPQFSSLLDIPQGLEAHLAPYLPDFQFDLFQLAEHSFESMPGTPAGILILRVMKAERLDQLLDDSVWDETLIKQISLELFQILLRYILAADIDKDAFKSRLQLIKDPQTKSSAMTLAYQLRQEGRQEGRHEGEVGLVIRLLRRKFPDVAIQVVPILERLDEEQLLSFGEALLFMQAPDECMAWLSGK
jgi:predicted transposase/invertase (TIGR01784 family)